MRTKSINDILRQADRIRAGYGWKARREKWDYDRYMEIGCKVDEIQGRYLFNIGSYMRTAEGMTKDFIARNFLTLSNISYKMEIYTNTNNR